MALTSVWAVQKALPPIDADITETETRVGGFTVLWKLGKGVFGAVKACRARDGSKEELALKTITKKNVRANPFHRRALSRRACIYLGGSRSSGLLIRSTWTTTTTCC